MDKQHLRLILNGKSAGRADVREGVDRVRSMGHDVSVRVTFEGGDVARLVQEALSDHAAGENIGTLVSGGGDGTLHQVVGALLQALPEGNKPPFALAVLPLGTANDFARYIELDPDDIPACLRFAATAAARPMDVGEVNGRFFVNMATGGFGTRVTAETDPKLKRVLGGAAYLFTGLTRFAELSACEARIEAEDFSFEGAFLALALGNSSQAGGGIQLCPNAKLDDGYLDLTILPVPESGKALELLANVFEYGVDGIRDGLIQRKVQKVSIRTEQPVQFNLDGEPMNGQDWQIGIWHQLIDMRR